MSDPSQHASDRAAASTTPRSPRPLPLVNSQRDPNNVSSEANKPAAVFSSTTTDLAHSPRRDTSSSDPSPAASKRSSFVDSSTSGQRPPTSPRAQRTFSFSGPALTELLMQPGSKPTVAEERFRGRDWRSIQLHEIVDLQETRFVELDTSIEDVTKLLTRSGAPNVVLVRESTRTRSCVGTFDYSDLNAYLLLVLGLSQADERATQLAERARAGEAIPLKDLRDYLGNHEEPAFLPHTATLTQAMEVLGGGSHRVMVNKDGTNETGGVLTQLRLVRFFWENHQNFAITEPLYQRTLKDLELGAKDVLTMNGDKPVSDALQLMHNKGITSLPVVDQRHNVVGNISHVDTRLLTDTSAIPLLSGSCIHFISVILSERGVADGKDSYPVFHVNPYSTLAHTVAKLCATRSHRMWIVDAPSPSASVPPSPGPHQAMPPLSLHQGSPHIQHDTPITTPVRHGSHPDPMTPGPPYTSISSGVSVSAGQLPGAAMSGRLSGVVSLTDVLNLFARASGLHPSDPEETRRRRRQSSSSSVQPSIDSSRGSMDNLRQSQDLSRSVDLGRSASKTSISNMR